MSHNTGNAKQLMWTESSG